MVSAAAALSPAPVIRSGAIRWPVSYVLSDPPDIAVLSTKAPDKAITSVVSPSAGVRFAGFEDASKKQIRCGSIHAFKGMESSAIIVTDVETIRGDQAASLFYTAMTRALHRLYILAHSNVKDVVLERILQT